jgi:hypothetical protein
MQISFRCSSAGARKIRSPHGAQKNITLMATMTMKYRETINCTVDELKFDAGIVAIVGEALFQSLFIGLEFGCLLDGGFNIFFFIFKFKFKNTLIV